MNWTQTYIHTAEALMCRKCAVMRLSVRYLSYGMLRCVVWLILTDVSEVLALFIIRGSCNDDSSKYL
jgi:hypothetical protein